MTSYTFRAYDADGNLRHRGTATELDGEMVAMLDEVDTSPAWKSWPLPAPGTDLHDWQDGRCAWCGCDNAALYARSMARDHCHDTGLVRGLLCAGCNTAEGSGGAEWDEWRLGDHPASAIGYFEVYQNSLRATPLSFTSALTYYTRDEQRAWWSGVEASVRSGGPFPSEAPWTDVAKARREAAEAIGLEAVNNLFNDLRRPSA